MKREKGLIRWILEHTEQKDKMAYTPVPRCPKYEMEVVHYHIGLCVEVGYLTATDVAPGESPHPIYEIGSLSWLGHEELERFRK